MRALRLALVLMALPALAGAQECRPQKTALVLSGGGVKGLAHLGVLRVLDSLGIRPDLIVGTSMGAIIGALYATGFDARQIDSLTRRLPIAEVVRPFRPPSPHPWDNRLPLLYLVRGRSGFTFQTGLVDEGQPNATLGAIMLRGNLLARGSFDRLPIPFRAVATDLRDRSTVVLSGGDLARAVRASSAIPLVFPPVTLDGAILVDGGLSANIPIAEARAAGATRVIVSDVTEHPVPTVDVESPLALADQLLGFLFQQPGARLSPGDIMVRPAVQGYRSLDFSAESIREILARGRAAADTTVGRASCLPIGPKPVAPTLPTTLAGWSVAGARSDSALLTRMLHLEVGDAVDPPALARRMVGLADAEGLRGVWLNPTGSGDSVSFQLEPIRSPTTVGGAGVAYDHDLGGRAWLGLFNCRVFGTSLEASGLLSLGRFQQELYGAALWHFDAGWSRVTPGVLLRVRAEDIRRFDPEGEELPVLASSDARAGAGIEVRVGRAWRIRPGADYLVWGTEPLRGEGAAGGSLRIQRTGRPGLELEGEAIVTDPFQIARVAASWPITGRSWSLVPAFRAAWGHDVPLQWASPLGGADGFPGLHLGEARGERELTASTRAGYSLFGPVQLRLLLAAGRTWSEGDPERGVTDWRAGARLGFGADTPIGPMEAAYGYSTGGRGAFYLRLGKWF